MKLSDSQKLDIVQEYLNSSINVANLAKKYMITPSAMGNFLKRRNIKVINKRVPKYSFNRSIFDVIDTEEKAYWLGFLFGDASNRGNYLSLELSKKDSNHLKKFQAFISSDSPIVKTKKNCCKILIYGKDFCSKLSSYGIIPRKTYLVNSRSRNIPENFICCFYRGVLDADGWVIRHKKKKCRDSFEFGFSSYHLNFLQEIKDWILSKLMVKNIGSIRERRRKKQKVCQFIIGGRNNFKLLYDIFYRDSIIYLDRKKSKANEFLKIIEES